MIQCPDLLPCVVASNLGSHQLPLRYPRGLQLLGSLASGCTPSRPHCLRTAGYQPGDNHQFLRANLHQKSANIELEGSHAPIWNVLFVCTNQLS